MVPNIGNLCLYLAFALSLILALSIFLKPNINFVRLFWAAIFIFVLSSLGCLIYSYVISDFSVLNVFNNSHVSKPLIYKISGAWGNHEGSMLLWLVVISFFSVVFAFLKLGFLRLVIPTLGVQALVFAMFALYVILASNPFVRIFPPPINGLGLTPLLQDIGLALHPPVLYLGYVGFSLAFSASIAGLLLNNVSMDWARMLKPWVLMSWSFLTMGIMLGSWWAYRELGWGGFWFWDPVENSSLMPWLCATALLHSLSVTGKSGKLAFSSVLLAILTFMFSMVGTFLVRSGIITSVHTFAVDPSRGLFILLILMALVSFALLLFALKGGILHSKQIFYIFSPEAFMLANNVLLSFIAFVIALGTFYPIIIEVVSGELVSVGSPYYNRIIPWVTFLLIFIMAIGSNFMFVKEQIVRLVKFDLSLLVLVVVAFVTAFVYIYRRFEVAFLGIGSSVWVLVVIVKLLVSKGVKCSSNFYVMVLAHLGVGFIVLGISITSAFQEEADRIIRLDEELVMYNNRIKLCDLLIEKGPNYISRKARFEVNAWGSSKYVLSPEIRYFITEKQQTTESAVLHKILYDLYFVMGDVYEEGISVKIFYKPGISLIWFGGVMLVSAGLLGVIVRIISLRRYFG